MAIWSEHNYHSLERRAMYVLSISLHISGPENFKLLLRYVDDYCYITTDRSKAIHFLDVMNAGRLVVMVDHA